LGQLDADYPDSRPRHFYKIQSQSVFVARATGKWLNYLNAAPLKDVYDRWISSYAENAWNLWQNLKAI